MLNHKKSEPYSKDQKLAILKYPELPSLVPSSVPLSWQWQEWHKHLQSHAALENQTENHESAKGDIKLPM